MEDITNTDQKITTEDFNIFAAMSNETETTAKSDENNDNGGGDALDLNNILDTDLLAAVIVPGLESLNKMVMRLALKNKVDASIYHFKNAEDLEKIISFWLKSVEIKNPKQIIGWILLASIVDNMGGMWADAISDSKKIAAAAPTTIPGQEKKYINFKDTLKNEQTEKNN
jgi:hypothetical protein